VAAIGHFTISKDSMSSPSGISVAGCVKSDFQEMSRVLLVVASKTAWQFEHVCKWVFHRKRSLLDAKSIDPRHAVFTQMPSVWISASSLSPDSKDRYGSIF